MWSLPSIIHFSFMFNPYTLYIWVRHGLSLLCRLWLTGLLKYNLIFIWILCISVSWAINLSVTSTGTNTGSAAQLRHHMGLWHPQGRRDVHTAALPSHICRAATRTPHQRCSRWRGFEAIHRPSPDCRCRHQSRWAASRLPWRRQHPGNQFFINLEMTVFMSPCYFMP